MDPEFIRDLFAPFRPVAVKRMFGGAGIYADGLMFALLFDGAIYLKVDETTIADFKREGSRPFVYTRAKSPGRVGRASLSYWRLPERLYDDPDELAVWAEREIAFPIGGGQTGRMKGDDYLNHFVLPNFYFHLTAAYAILRRCGLEIGKRDFLGAIPVKIG